MTTGFHLLPPTSPNVFQSPRAPVLTLSNGAFSFLCFANGGPSGQYSPSPTSHDARLYLVKSFSLPASAARLFPPQDFPEPQPRSGVLLCLPKAPGFLTQQPPGLRILHCDCLSQSTARLSAPEGGPDDCLDFVTMVNLHLPGCWHIVGHRLI